MNSLAMVLVLACCLSACATWQELTPQPGGRVTLDSTRTYRLAFSTGDSLVVRHATVTGDSIRWSEELRHGVWVNQPDGRGLRDIRRVEALGGSGVSGSDASVVLVALAGVGVILLLAAVGNMSFLGH